MSLYKITQQKLQYLRYSENTIESYLHYVAEFECKIKKHHSRINASDIQDYVDQYTFSSWSQQNQIIRALKFVWFKVLGKKYLKIDFTRPRKEKRLPRIISHDYLMSRINNIQNLKHKAILWTAYSTGMRRSEIQKLAVKDIDSKRMLIMVKNGKGMKDRFVPLSNDLLSLLKQYYKMYRPEVYLFGGVNGLYSSTSLNNLVKKYLGYDYSFHTLRHSAFTRMLDVGVDLRHIQLVAGHSNVNTTCIYTHTSTESLKRIATPC